MNHDAAFVVNADGSSEVVHEMGDPGTRGTDQATSACRENALLHDLSSFRFLAFA